jgi:hypothetical protein
MSHNKYQGKGFLQWIKQETHFLLRHRGCYWKEGLEGGEFFKEGNPISRETYLRARNAVFEQAVEAGIELFTKYDWNFHRWEKGENLRRNLWKQVCIAI